MNTFHTRLTLTQQLKITIQVQAVKTELRFYVADSTKRQ